MSLTMVCYLKCNDGYASACNNNGATPLSEPLSPTFKVTSRFSSTQIDT